MKNLKRMSNNLYLLSFLNGVLLTCLFYFKSQSRFEDSLFDSIAKNVSSTLKPGDNDDSIAVKSLHTCYNLMHNRANIFADGGPDHDLTSFLNPVTVDLMTTRGACGSYSAVLARLLRREGFPVRIAQMKANGIFGAHNIVEVNLGSRWAALDPTYDLYFIRPDKKIAGFDDIRGHWAYYIHQLPEGYNSAYHYEDVRYTNWEKLPLIMPAIRKILDYCLGESKVNTISLHVYFLRIYSVCFYVILGLLLLASVHTYRNIAAKGLLPRYQLRLLPGKRKPLLSPSGSA